MTPEREEELRIMSLPGMQELFREKMGRVQVGDSLHFDGVTEFVEGIAENSLYSIQMCDGSAFKPNSKFIRLPIPIDPDNPSRGLSGMIDGDFILQRWPDLWSATIAKPQMKYFEAATPTLALLKAIAAQEGIEI